MSYSAGLVYCQSVDRKMDKTFNLCIKYIELTVNMWIIFKLLSKSDLGRKHIEKFALHQLFYSENSLHCMKDKTNY